MGVATFARQADKLPSWCIRVSRWIQRGHQSIALRRVLIWMGGHNAILITAVGSHF